MCRSTAQGGRRCTGHGHTTESSLGIVPDMGKTHIAEPRLSRAAFLAKPVAELAHVTEDGDVVVAAKPAGMSDKAYRDHLASGPRMTVRMESGALYGKCDPETARVLIWSERTKGRSATATWETR